MGNAREIVSRLDARRFHVSMFFVRQPDPRIAMRENTRLIQLPMRRQTPHIFREFLWGKHQVLFYMKSSPASRWYLSLRSKWKDGRITIGTIEASSALRPEPTISEDAVQLWEHTILRCDYLFSNSRSVQESLQREYRLASEIIPTGVDTRFYVPLQYRAPNPRPRVFFAGSLRHYKQPQCVVDAAARFTNADFRIAGEGSLAPVLASRVAELGLRNVSILGLLSAEQLRGEYQNADVFFFPSKWEGSPKVVLEAAACGLPVIVRNDYAPETVLDGLTGYVTNSDEQIFDRLEALLGNPALRQQMGANGRRLSEKYDWNLITMQWEDTFSRLMRRDARRAS
ncbi:MAG TPA: glycosyltransferase family 4 protein [Terriglobales bacterium]|nr:glycosyltransferase family 4 protein [Terriglobales bacterium]